MADAGTPTTGEQAGAGAPQLNYVRSTDLWDTFEERLVAVIRASGAVDVGELGGGANPAIGLAAQVGRPLNLTVLDISSEQLDRTPAGVDTLCVDLCAEQPPVHERFDLVFSRMLCEHVRSGRTFHRNCHAALRPGGRAVHFFPAASALPFAVNRVLPVGPSERILESLFPARKRGGNHDKFPAYYKWCWGPTRRQVERYRAVGFEVESCDVGIGHGYYEPLPGLRHLEKVKTELVLRRPSPWLAAYVLVVLRRTK